MNKMDTRQTALVDLYSMPEKEAEKIRTVISSRHLPDVRFFHMVSTPELLPRTPKEAVEIMNAADIAVDPGIEKRLYAPFLTEYRKDFDETYFAIISPTMLFEHDAVSTHEFLDKLCTYELLCSVAHVAVFRAQYLAQYRHVEITFNVATNPLQGEYILTISNTYKGNFMSMRKHRPYRKSTWQLAHYVVIFYV